MIRLKTLYFGVVISLLTTSRAYSAASTPADTVRMFYNWYVHEVLNGAKPVNQERTEIRKFVTERLLTEIDNRHKSAGGAELDPFFNTREIDPEWEKKRCYRKPLRRAHCAAKCYSHRPSTGGPGIQG